MQQGTGLQNKRVVILGGSSGIGLAIAEQVASQGAKIVIASSNAERVQKAVEPFGKDAQGHTLDLSVEQAVETLFTKLGAFDHLVFTAGDSLPLHDLATTDLKQARRAFELRYWAALAAVKYGSRIFARVAQSCSPPELPGSARIKDGLLPPAFAEPSKP
jgi:NAD(P)-dependent dehydrogenase (short-subunit alcohol dehydrogenase family)